MNAKEPAQSRPDPLIDEIRAIRKSISDESGNDVNGLCQRLAEVQRRYADRLQRPKDVAGK